MSIREDEDPKLLLDSVEPLPTDAEVEQMRAAGALNGDVSEQPLPGGKLYLRLPDDSAIAVIQPILQRFPGTVPVTLYILSTGAKLRAPQSLFVVPTQSLMDALCDALGAKNVVLK